MEHNFAYKQILLNVFNHCSLVSELLTPNTTGAYAVIELFITKKFLIGTPGN